MVRLLPFVVAPSILFAAPENVAVAVNTREQMNQKIYLIHPKNRFRATPPSATNDVVILMSLTSATNALYSAITNLGYRVTLLESTTNNLAEVLAAGNEADGRGMIDLGNLEFSAGSSIVNSPVGIRLKDRIGHEILVGSDITRYLYNTNNVVVLDFSGNKIVGDGSGLTNIHAVEAFTGTVTRVVLNSVTNSPNSSGIVNLGTISGGGVSAHPSLTALDWDISGHTGDVNKVAAFSSGGAATYKTIGSDIQAWDTDLDRVALKDAGALTNVVADALAYASTWNGSNKATTRNDVYDKIEEFFGSGGSVGQWAIAYKAADQDGLAAGGWTTYLADTTKAAKGHSPKLGGGNKLFFPAAGEYVVFGKSATHDHDADSLQQWNLTIVTNSVTTVGVSWNEPHTISTHTWQSHGMGVGYATAYSTNDYMYLRCYNGYIGTGVLDINGGMHYTTFGYMRIK